MADGRKEGGGAMDEAADRPRGFDEEGAAGAAARTGHLVIRDYLKRLDDRPGVYRMLDAKGDVLYVGKARSLRKRVASYAKPTGHDSRIGRMIAATASMMFLTTETETEALLLEQNLIKQLKPRYNVLLRDDKSFPAVLVTADHRFPQVKKHRGLRKEPGRYFGPFASAGSVNRTLNQLQKAFLLRSCSDSMFESRTRPCLLFQIKRCSAPCVGLIGEDDYAALVEDAVLFLSGKSTKVQAHLAGAMQAASAAMAFERAAALRDRIRALTAVQANQGINPEGVEEADVVALHQEGGHACVQVFFIRAHQNWGNRAYFPRTGSGAPPGEILEAFLGQFYGNKTPARMILVSHVPDNADLLTEALSAQLGRKVAIAAPQRGEKAGLVEQAARNAREALARRMAESASQAALLDGHRRGLRARRGAGADRGLRQQPHHGDERGRGDDRRRARGVREVAVPQVQHQGRHRAGRRLRDDARGADPALRAAGEGGPGPAVGRLAGSGADRRRAGAGGGGLRGAAGARDRRGAGRRASPRASTATRARRSSTGRGSRRWRSGIATRCSISSSGCATRRTASRSGRTGRSGRRRRGRRRSTRCRGSARRASGRCSRTSARPRR